MNLQSPDAPNRGIFFSQSMIVTPHLLSGGTDSKHYAKLAPTSIYRFVPLVMNRTANDVARIHGKDERVKVRTLQTLPILHIPEGSGPVKIQLHKCAIFFHGNSCSFCYSVLSIRNRKDKSRSSSAERQDICLFLSCLLQVCFLF